MTAEREPQTTFAEAAPLAWAQKFQRLAVELVEAHNPREVLDVVVAFGVTVADARAGAIALLDSTGSRLELAASHGVLFKRGAYNYAAMAHDEETITAIESAASAALVELLEEEGGRA